MIIRWEKMSNAFFLPLLKILNQCTSDSSAWLFTVCTIQLGTRIRLLLFRSLIVIVVEAHTIRTGLVGEMASQRRWNGKLFPHVEQNIRFTLSNCVCGCWSYRAIVKVKPLSVVNSEGSVMSSSSSKINISKCIAIVFINTHNRKLERDLDSVKALNVSTISN